jgi:hypothetical protein
VHLVRVSPVAVELAVEALAVQRRAGKKYILCLVAEVFQSNGAGRLKVSRTFDGPGASWRATVA